MKPWSAHINLQGQHDYNKMPLATLDCHIMTLNKPKTRTSWGPRVSKGFYVGTSTEHYHCFKIWMKNTCSICISDTVQFHHKFIMAQRNTNNNDVATADKNLPKALLKTTLVQLNKMKKQALQHLNKLFTNAVTIEQKQQTNKLNVNYCIFSQ